MNTQLLEYMIAVSEEKSLSKAAERLLVTQPALSQQLKKLELELDAKLFQREKNELVLTDAGRVYINGARSVLSLYESAEREIKKIKDSGKKQITIVYNNALLPSFSTKVLTPFMELHQEVFLSTIDGNTAVAKDYLTNGLADIGVLATREASHSMLEYIPLRKDELLLAIPGDHPMGEAFEKTKVDFNALKNDCFILNQADSYFRSMEGEILSASQITPNVLCEISDLNASRNMVINGRGNAFLPRSMDHDSDRYRCFSLEPRAEFHIVMAFYKSKPLTKAVKDIILLLLNAYENM